MPEVTFAVKTVNGTVAATVMYPELETVLLPPAFVTVSVTV